MLRMEQPENENNNKVSLLSQGALPVIVEADEVSRLEGEHLEVLEEAFALFDIDGNGFISLDELTAVMQSIGKDCAEEDMKEMLDLADKDGDGELGFDDFHDLMREAIILGVQEDDLREAFDVFDTDGDGYITPAEVQKLFLKLGENMTMDEALELMEEMNTNTDGLVDFREFKAYYEKDKNKVKT